MIGDENIVLCKVHWNCFVVFIHCVCVLIRYKLRSSHLFTVGTLNSTLSHKISVIAQALLNYLLVVVFHTIEVFYVALLFAQLLII